MHRESMILRATDPLQRLILYPPWQDLDHDSVRALMLPSAAVCGISIMMVKGAGPVRSTA
jgi:hypothetical protein